MYEEIAVSLKFLPTLQKRPMTYNDRMYLFSLLAIYKCHV